MIYRDGYVHGNWNSLWKHSDLQDAPITVHISISINHTVIKFWQSHILEMMIRTNDCCMQQCTHWWWASDARNMYQFMYIKTLLSLQWSVCILMVYIVTNDSLHNWLEIYHITTLSEKMSLSYSLFLVLNRQTKPQYH